MVGVIPRVVLVLVLLLGLPAGALAHSGAGTASDYRTEPGELRTADGAVVPGARIDVIGGDDRLRLRWSGAGELIVRGYAGEPYLRLGRDGAFENSVAPSVVANRERFGGVVDAASSTGAPPQWRRISDEPVAVWHDHRSHWMSEAAPPPGVARDPDREQTVQRWEIPMTVAGGPAAVSGRLVYLPPPSPWPWVALALVIALVSGALALLGSARLAVAVARAGAATALVVGVTLAAGEAAAAPADGLTEGIDGGLPPTLQAALWVLGASGALVVWALARRRGSGHEAVVMLAIAWVLGGGVALARLGHLGGSILPEPYPEAAGRLMVVLCLAAIAAPTAWAWRALAGARADAGGRRGRGYTRRAPTATRWGVAKR